MPAPTTHAYTHAHTRTHTHTHTHTTHTPDAKGLPGGAEPTRNGALQLEV